VANPAAGPVADLKDAGAGRNTPGSRERLETLYGDERTEGGKVKATMKSHAAPPAHLRQQMQELPGRLRQEYAQLKVQWGGDTEYDEWFMGREVSKRAARDRIVWRYWGQRCR
jgi:predicted aminopeptidase